MRSNSGNRSGRRARRVSAGVSEDALATDSGVFEAWGRRWAEFNRTPHGAIEPPSGRGGDSGAAPCAAMTDGKEVVTVSKGVDGASPPLQVQGPCGSSDKHLRPGGLLIAVLNSPSDQRGPTPKVKESLAAAALAECC